MLDTNVVSEALRPMPDETVIAWLDAQLAETLFLTSINLAELLGGVARLPSGRRRADLAARLTNALRRLFEDRVLPFDRIAAETYAPLAAKAEAQGVQIGFADGQIAAIASAAGFAVASCDRRPFEAAGLTVIDPWSEG